MSYVDQPAYYVSWMSDADTPPGKWLCEVNVGTFHSRRTLQSWLVGGNHDNGEPGRVILRDALGMEPDDGIVYRFIHRAGWSIFYNEVREVEKWLAEQGVERSQTAMLL